MSAETFSPSSIELPNTAFQVEVVPYQAQATDMAQLKQGEHNRKLVEGLQSAEAIPQQPMIEAEPAGFVVTTETARSHRRSERAAGPPTITSPDELAPYNPDAHAAPHSYAAYASLAAKKVGQSGRKYDLLPEPEQVSTITNATPRNPRRATRAAESTAPVPAESSDAPSPIVTSETPVIPPSDAQPTPTAGKLTERLRAAKISHLVDINKRGRATRPDKQVMTSAEVDLITAHKDQIEAGLADRAVEHRFHEQLADVDGPMDALAADRQAQPAALDAAEAAALAAAGARLAAGNEPGASGNEPDAPDHIDEAAAEAVKKRMDAILRRADAVQDKDLRQDFDEEATDEKSLDDHFDEAAAVANEEDSDRGIRAAVGNFIGRSSNILPRAGVMFTNAQTRIGEKLQRSAESDNKTTRRMGKIAVLAAVVGGTYALYRTGALEAGSELIGEVLPESVKEPATDKISAVEYHAADIIGNVKDMGSEAIKETKAAFAETSTAIETVVEQAAEPEVAATDVPADLSTAEAVTPEAAATPAQGAVAEVMTQFNEITEHTPTIWDIAEHRLEVGGEQALDQQIFEEMRRLQDLNHIHDEEAKKLVAGTKIKV